MWIIQLCRDNIQSIVDSVKLAKIYSTNGGSVYLNVDFYGNIIAMIETKKTRIMWKASIPSLDIILLAYVAKADAFLEH